MTKEYKKPKSENINIELETYRRKRSERLSAVSPFLKRLYAHGGKKED